MALPERTRAGHPQRPAHLLLKLAGDLRDVAQRAVDLLDLQQLDLADFGQHQLVRVVRWISRAPRVGLQASQLAREDRLQPSRMAAALMLPALTMAEKVVRSCGLRMTKGRQRLIVAFDAT